MKSGFIPVFCAAVLLSCSFSAAAGGLTIKDPWVRAAPPGAPALGAFMTLENHGEGGKAVVSARTTLAVDRVELHRTMMVGDVMKMVPQENIPVPAQETTLLKPGSWHVMLIGPEKVPQKGDKVQITLEFSDGSEQTVEAVVREGKMNMQAHKNEMKHEMKHEMKQQQKHEMKKEKKLKANPE